MKNIWSAVNNTGYSSAKMKKSTTHCCWKTLCPNFVLHFQGFGETPEYATKDNIHLMMEMNLGVSTEDVDELPSSYSQMMFNEDFTDKEEENIPPPTKHNTAY